MAIFESSKTTLESTTIQPTVVRTENVAKEMQKIASKHNVNVNSLDFNLLEVFSYTRLINEGKDAEWENIENRELYSLGDAEALLNPYFEMKQTYEIEVFSAKNAPNNFPDLKVAIGANATKCKVYMSIAQGSKIEGRENLQEDLKDLIDKRKVRAGILVNIFDEMLRDVISKISARVKVEKSVVYDQKETFLIADGLEPVPTKNDALIFHYKDKDLTAEDKINYAARGFIQGVQKDELLIEYIKSIKGSSGRNCRGKYLAPKEPIISKEATFTIDDTIHKEESKTNIKYIAKENGYIALKNGVYSIKKEMDIKEISFKKTGSVLSGVDSDVHLNVNEKDVNKDAIGSGMEVEVARIVIDGNVGSSANVLALKASVGGQTHKTSFVKADELEINVHKGKAEGKEVHITRLEHGKVDGDSVTVDQALGGSVRAKDITIDLCGSHVQAVATHHIEIKKLQGSENSFIIDPLLKEDLQKSLNENKKAIKKLEGSIKSIESEVQTLEETIKKGTRSFLDIKKRLVHYKKNGVKLPGAFVQKYKAFTKLHEDLKLLESECKVKNETLLLYTSRTSSFQDNILDARIINRDRWVGYNEIKFKIVDPVMELVHKPAEGSRDMIFGLVRDEEGNYMIEAMEE